MNWGLRTTICRCWSDWDQFWSSEAGSRRDSTWEGEQMFVVFHLATIAALRIPFVNTQLEGMIEGAFLNWIKMGLGYPLLDSYCGRVDDYFINSFCVVLWTLNRSSSFSIHMIVRLMPIFYPIHAFVSIPAHSPQCPLVVKQTPTLLWPSAVSGVSFL